MATHPAVPFESFPDLPPTTDEQADILRGAVRSRGARRRLDEAVWLEGWESAFLLGEARKPGAVAHEARVLLRTRAAEWAARRAIRREALDRDAYEALLADAERSWNDVQRAISCDPPASAAVIGVRLRDLRQRLGGSISSDPGDVMSGSGSHDAPSGAVDSATRAFDPTTFASDSSTRTFDPAAFASDSSTRTFDPAALELASSIRTFDPAARALESSTRAIDRDALFPAHVPASADAGATISFERHADVLSWPSEAPEQADASAFGTAVWDREALLRDAGLTAVLDRESVPGPAATAPAETGSPTGPVPVPFALAEAAADAVDDLAFALSDLEDDVEARLGPGPAEVDVEVEQPQAHAPSPRVAAPVVASFAPVVASAPAPARAAAAVPALEIVPEDVEAIAAEQPPARAHVTSKGRARRGWVAVALAAAAVGVAAAVAFAPW